jgi:3-hydroxybutyryl-CoA dehydrogenase
MIMQLDDIRRILVVGAGTMGHQIALQCATHGYDVTLYDLNQPILNGARAQITSHLADMVSAGQLTEEQATQILARIATTTDAAAAGATADLLSESVPEDPELKARVLAQFNGLCPQQTIFTTNTSFLIPSMFADATGRPTQFAALHFHLPVRIANIVDVMPHPGTAPEVVDLLQAFAQRIGQVPIRYKQETHGYIFNAMLGAIMREALTLVANDVARVEDVDRSWMGIMKMRLGPFGIMDSIGLETVYTITAYWARILNDIQGFHNAQFLKQLIDEGRLGVKSGHGFYSYPQPAFQRPGFVEGNALGSEPGQ